MKREQFKVHERVWAEMLGGIRVPITGRQRGATPDVEHPVFSVEIKAGQGLVSTRLEEGIEQAVAAADRIITTGGAKRFPVVCISNTGKGRKRTSSKYVLMRAEDFIAWMNGKGQ